MQPDQARIVFITPGAPVETVVVPAGRAVRGAAELLGVGARELVGDTIAFATTAQITYGEPGRGPDRVEWRNGRAVITLGR